MDSLTSRSRYGIHNAHSLSTATRAVRSVNHTLEGTVLNPILPRSADNDYGGSRLALVIFGLLLVMRTAVSLGSIFNGYNAATSADGIPHWRKVIQEFLPIARVGTPPGDTINVAILGVIIVGLALSLWSRGDHTNQGATAA